MNTEYLNREVKIKKAESIGKAAVVLGLLFLGYLALVAPRMPQIIETLKPIPGY